MIIRKTKESLPQDKNLTKAAIPSALSNDDPELNSFKLPEKHKPKKYLSEHVIKDPAVMKEIVGYFLGEDKSGFYDIENTGWFYNSISDVVYMPIVNSIGLPPFLINIQNKVNEEIIEHLNEYALHIKKKTNRSPIVLIINKGLTVGHDLKSNLEKSNHRHLLELQSYPWAKVCFLLSKSTLQIQASEKLNIISAMGIFFTDQKQSITEHHQKDDHYLKLLYSIVG